MLRSIAILNIAENHNQKYFLATTFTQLYLASDMPQILSDTSFLVLCSRRYLQEHQEDYHIAVDLLMDL